MKEFSRVIGGRVVFTFALALLAGILTGVGGFIPLLWFLPTLSLAFTLGLLFSSSARHSFPIGLAFGAGLMFATFSCGFGSLPLDWLGVPNIYASVILVLFLELTFSMFIALAYGVWAWVMRMQEVGWILMCTVPTAWVATEFLHALLHSIIAWRLSAALNAEFSFGFIGYALSWSDYLWLARVGGVPVLSAFSAYVAVMLFLTWRYTENPRARRVASVAILALFIAGGVALPYPIRVEYRPEVIEASGLRIVPISTEIPSALKRTKKEFEDIERMVANAILVALAKNPDVIVLPEYVRYLKSENLLTEAESSAVRDALAAHNVLLIDSQRATQENGYFGQILWYDGGKRLIVATQNKRLLIPFGEYLPWFFDGALRRTGFSDLVASIEKHRTYAVSQAPYSSRQLEWKGVNLGVLACSETLSPFGYKELSDAGADVLINVASHAWLRDGSVILAREVEAMARVHAVYTGKIFIQAANHSPSFVIYPAYR